MPEITREAILTGLRQALEPLPYVNAMWEGGAASFDRVDEWSDIDLQVDVEDEKTSETWQAIEQAITALTPIALRYEIPQPAWHGSEQVFYILENASPFLMLDLVVIKHSNPQKFLEREIHGRAVVHFDRAAVTNVPPLDIGAHAATLKGRLVTLRVLFELFRTLTLKELNRGNSIEAVAFYNGYTLRPLVEALRIRYAPFHYNFHTRYIHYEFPSELVKTLEALFFPTDPADLRQKRDQAEALFFHTLDYLDHLDMEAHVRSFWPE